MNTINIRYINTIIFKKYNNKINQLIYATNVSAYKAFFSVTKQ